MIKGWTAEKFEPAIEEDFDDYATYCVYCYEEASDHEQRFGCCGENHFLTGKQIKDNEKELDEIDRQVRGASGKVYDPPMTDTEQYLLNKEREEEHKSYDY